MGFKAKGFFDLILMHDYKAGAVHHNTGHWDVRAERVQRLFSD
jgi:hypothetical protein